MRKYVHRPCVPPNHSRWASSVFGATLAYASTPLNPDSRASFGVTSDKSIGLYRVDFDVPQSRAGIAVAVLHARPLPDADAARNLATPDAGTQTLDEIHGRILEAGSHRVSKVGANGRVTVA